jgi:hypothetical protein
MGLNAIASAISSFHGETNEWPDRQGTNPDFYEVLRSGNTNASSAGDFELFGTPSTGNVEDPDVGGTDWAATTSTVDAFVNHLTLDEAGYKDNGINWDGPYMPQVFNDPWGRNYLIYAKAYTAGDNGTDDIYVWVISAGPNETLETNVTSPILNDDPDETKSTSADDIGKMTFRFREGIKGVQ